MGLGSFREAAKFNRLGKLDRVEKLESEAEDN